MALPVLTANSPSVGYISWTATNLMYVGTSYVIPAGNTNKRFTVWKYNNGSPTLVYTDSLNSITVTDDDLLLFLNKNGTPVNAQKTQVVEGSLIVEQSILADALAANSVTAEKILAGSVDATKIKAGTITANEMAADSITGRELAIADFTNYAQNALFDDGAVGWTATATGWSITSGGSGGVPSFVSRNTAGAADLVNNYRIPARAGESYNVSGLSYNEGGAAAQVGLIFYNGSGVSISEGMATLGGSQTSWTPFSANIPVPNNASFASLQIRHNGTGTARFGNMFNRRRFGGSLIVDGGIIADNIAANAITGDKIAANSVTAREIAADAISARQIAIADFTNLASGSDFEDPALIPWTLSGAGATISTAQSNSGSQSLQFNGAASGSASLKSFSVTAGESIYFRLYVYRDANWNGTSSSRLRIDNQSGTQLAFIGLGSTDLPSATWTPLTLTYTVPAGVTKLGVSIVATAGNLWVDDILIRRRFGGELIVDGTITSNLISARAIGAEQLYITSSNSGALNANGSFEESGPATAYPPGWRYAEGQNVATGYTTQAESTAPSGGNVGVIKAGANRAMGTTAVPVVPGRTYEFKSMIRSLATAGSHYVRIFWATSLASGADSIVQTTRNGYGAIRENQPNTGISSWTSAGTVWTAPSNAYWASLVFYNWTGNNGDLQIDDVSIKEQAGATLIQDGAIITDKIAANAVVADKIATNAIETDKLAANAVTANKLNVVVGGGNLLNNTLLKTADSWTGNGPITATMPVNRSASATGGLVFASGASYQYRLQQITLQPGTYVFSCWVSASVDGVSSANGAGVQVQGVGGRATVLERVVFQTVNTGWARSYMRFTVTTASQFDFMLCNTYGGTTSGGSIYIVQPQLEEGEVPTSYSPKGDEILPGTINSAMIQTDAVIADKIVGGAVTADKIAANAVTANKLNVVMGGGNMLTNSSFRNSVSALTDWTVAGLSGSVRTATLQTGVSKSMGYNSYRLIRTDTSLPIIFSHAAVAIGAGPYVASMWVRHNATSQPGLAIDIGGGQDGARVYSNPAIVGSWQRVSTIRTVTTDGSVAPRVFIDQAISTGASGIDFCMVQMEAGEYVTAYSPRTDEILPGTVVAASIATDAVTADKIQAGAVAAEKIAAGAVTTEKLTVGSIGDTAINNGSFEELSTTDATLPAGWDRGLVYGGTATTVLATTTSPLSGSRSVNLTASPGVAVPTGTSVATSTSGGTLAASTTYSYRVAAEHLRADGVTGTTAAAAAVTVTTGAGSANSNTVSWTAVTGATGYRVYGRAAGSELLIASVSGQATVSYTDDGSVTPAGAVPTGSTAFSNATIVLSSGVPVVPGERWYLSFTARNTSSINGLYARLRGGTTATAAGVEAGAAAGNTIENLTSTTTATRYETSFVIPAGMLYARPIIFNYGQGQTAGAADNTLTIDDVTFRKVTVSAMIADGAITASKVAAEAITSKNLTVGALTDNLISNPGFEDWDTATKPALWAQATGSGYGGTYSKVTGGSQIAGTSSAGMTPSSGNSLRLSTERLVSAVAGEKLYVAFSVRSSVAVTNGLTIGIDWLNNAGTVLSTTTSAYNIATTVSRFNHVGTAPTSAVNARVFVQANSAAATRLVTVGDSEARRLVGGALIAEASILSANIADGQITNLKVANGIDASKISVGYLNASVIDSNTITSGMIRGDAIDGKTITGAIVRTAESGQRVQLDTGGVFGYNSGGTAMTTISSSTGLLTATGGTFRSSTATQRIEINSNGLFGYDSGGNLVTTVSSTTGQLTASGGVFRSSNATQRVEITSSGFFGYDSGGNPVTSISSSTGQLIATGALFRSSTGAARVQLDSNGLEAYSGTTNQYVQIDSNGINAYGGAGVANTTISASTGQLTAVGVNIKSGTTTQRVELNSSGLTSYDSSGSPNTTISSADGTLTAYGATITGIISSNRGLFNSTANATTAAGNTPALRVGDPAGRHLRMDGNEMLAMNGDATPGDLYLNSSGITRLNNVNVMGMFLSAVNFNNALFSQDAMTFRTLNSAGTRTGQLQLVGTTSSIVDAKLATNAVGIVFQGSRVGIVNPGYNNTSDFTAGTTQAFVANQVTAFNGLFDNDLVRPNGTQNQAAYLTPGGKITNVAPSATRFKQDIEPMQLDEARSALGMNSYRFRYKDDVEAYGDRAPYHPGVLAEQAEEAGLGLWVIRDHEGPAMSFKYAELSVAHNMLIKDHETLIRDLYDRIETLESQLATDNEEK